MIFFKRFSSIPPHVSSMSFFKILRWKARVMFKKTPGPWSVDDVLALSSWLFVGNSLFVLAGTTTAVSLGLFVANTLNSEEMVAKAVGRYLTKSTGATITFESAIVPKWKEGIIRLRNVNIKRLHAVDESKMDYKYIETQKFWEPEEGNECNFTKYDLKVREIDITLDLMRWFQNKGLVSRAVVRGVRGVIDRTGIQPDSPTWPRREYIPGDFELEQLNVEDVFLTAFNPMFRPYPVSILSAEIHRFRKQWILYDVLNASSLVGMIDDCLFTLHTPQIENNKNMKRLKIDWLPIDHLNYGTKGPFSWINEGTVSIDAMILIPTEVKKSVREIILELSKQSQLTNKWLLEKQKALVLWDDVPQLEPMKVSDELLKMDIDLKFDKIKVHPKDSNLDYLSSAWIRPLAAYMNSHRVSIPISLSLNIPIHDFNGSWTIYQAGVADALAQEVGKTIVANMLDETERARRIRRISLWSIHSISKTFADFLRFQLV